MSWTIKLTSTYKEAEHNHHKTNILSSATNDIEVGKAEISVQYQKETMETRDISFNDTFKKLKFNYFPTFSGSFDQV